MTEAGRLPAGNMAPLGHVVLGHGGRLNRPVQAYQRWITRIPEDFHGVVLGESEPPAIRIRDASVASAA